MSSDPLELPRIHAEFENREKTKRGAQRAADTFWRRLVNTVGRDLAEQIMLGAMEMKKPGAPRTEDAIDHQIRACLKLVQAAKARKVFPGNIADFIQSGVVRVRRFGPRGEELEPVKVPLPSRAALLKRIERIRKEMNARGELPEKYGPKPHLRD